MSDAPSAFRQVIRTARKEHKCCECGTSIKPREQYAYSSGVWDGEACDFKQCLICFEVSSAASSISDDPDEKPCFSALRDWFANQVCRDFQGQEFVSVFARDMQVVPEKIWHVLGDGFFEE
jgi:ribosomal protein L37AE/L43A